MNLSGIVPRNANYPLADKKKPDAGQFNHQKMNRLSCPACGKDSNSASELPTPTRKVRPGGNEV